jgi:Transposase IS116/IS110/IS902 family
VIDLLDERIAPLDQEPGPLGRADRRCRADHHPRYRPRARTHDRRRDRRRRPLSPARKLVRYAGVAPRVKQSGERSRSRASLR